MKGNFDMLRTAFLNMPEADREFVRAEWDSTKDTQKFLPCSKYHYMMLGMYSRVKVDAAGLYNLKSMTSTVARLNGKVKQLHMQHQTAADARQRRHSEWQQQMALLFGPSNAKPGVSYHLRRTRRRDNCYRAESNVPATPGDFTIELSFADVIDFMKIRDMINEALDQIDAEKKGGNS